MTTETKTKPTSDTGSVWPPVAHYSRTVPPKAGDYALCGAKLMSIDLRNTAVQKMCKKCLEIAERTNL